MTFSSAFTNTEAQKEEFQDPNEPYLQHHQFTKKKKAWSCSPIVSDAFVQFDNTEEHALTTERRRVAVPHLSREAVSLPIGKLDE